MAIQKKTVRLLILEDSQNEAERLVNLFRNAGRATRVHRLTSAEDLAEALQQTWDLLIAAPDSENLQPYEALATLRRQAKDIPFIQLVEGEDSDAITEALTLGAQDAVPQGEDERLVLAANRELSNLDERRGRRAAEVALREAEKRCQLLLDSSVDAIAYVHDGMHIYANRAYLELFGYADADELEGTPVIDLIEACDQTDFKDFLKHYLNTETNTEFVCSGIRSDGQSFRARMHFSPASYDGEPCIQVVIRREADTRHLEERLLEISSQDPITGLYNRSYFLEQLDVAAQRAVAGGQPATLAYLRLDRHAANLVELGIGGTDALLKQVGGLLNEYFRPGLELAHFGDDVFTVLYDGIPPEQTKAELEALLPLFENHLFDVAGRTVQVTLSIGVAGLDEKTANPQEIIDRAHRCADELQDGNGLKLYDPTEELVAAANRGNIVAMLQHALDTDGFRLLFQPVISLRGDNHENYEVLLRLLAPNGDEVAAADFIGTARQAGLAQRIDRWVVLNAVKLLAEHLSKGHQTRLFVHLSEASLLDESFLPWLKAAMEAARLPADALVFQFSEPDAVTYLKQAKALIQGLNGLRCRAALSQFGCAINPFNALRHLEVDFVKVDGSFTQDLSRAENQDVLKALLTELHAQGKRSIVPFVESASVLATLWQAGVSYIQGYYLQGPSQSMDYDFSDD